MRLYTRTGDGGETFVIGERVRKDDPRVEAYGTIDELNAAVGLTVAMMDGQGGENGASLEDLRAQLVRIQHELFDCGSDLAYAAPDPSRLKVGADMVRRLESWIDALTDEAPPLRRFILPGGSRIAACLHLCRTICRRAERRVVTLGRHQPCPEDVRRYLNRLSDYFFAAARAVNARLGVEDQEYERSADVFRPSSSPPEKRGNPETS
jgi:cob(I)alamin adenosyltransferase